MLSDRNSIERALSLLAAALEAQSAGPYEIVVVGGAALSAMGIGVRATRDVDVLGLRENLDRAAGSGVSPSPAKDDYLVKQKPLPAPLLAAAKTVASALGLDAEWLNAGPADLLDHGLPEGFARRLRPVHYGPRLTVWLPSREDLICLKTYAAADLGIGRHTEDLHALHATCGELRAGAIWARSQDPSEAFREMLVGLLRYFGCEAAAEEMGRG